MREISCNVDYDDDGWWHGFIRTKVRVDLDIDKYVVVVWASID